MASQQVIDSVIKDIGDIVQGCGEAAAVEACRQRCIEHLKYTRPSDWDHYSSAQQPWREEERRVVEEFLIRFRPAKMSNIALYTKIAALLPRKTARDVAVMIAAMRKEERSLFEEEEKRNQQRSLQAQLAAAQANAQALSSQVVARGLSAAASAALGPQMDSNNAPLGGLLKPTNPAIDPMLQNASFKRGAGRPPFGMAGRGRGLRGGRPALGGRAQGGRAVPEQKEEFEMLIHKTLQGNVLIIGKMRENLLTGKLMDNYALMQKFDENINIILSMLDSLQCRMPPLPVQVNKLLLSAHQSQNDNLGGALNFGNNIQQQQQQPQNLSGESIPSSTQDPSSTMRMI